MLFWTNPGSNTPQLYGHLTPISQTIQVRRTRHAGHYYRSKDELICDFLKWNFTYERVSVGWPAMTCIHQVCVDTGYRTEDLSRVMNNKDRWRVIDRYIEIDRDWRWETDWQTDRELHAICRTWLCLWQWPKNGDEFNIKEKYKTDP